MLVVGAGRVAHEKVTRPARLRRSGDRRRARDLARGRGAPRRAAAPRATGAPTSPAATSSSPRRRPRPSTRRVFADAEARALLCNVVDVPELCSFILPALHREDPITVAVSTGGASPALAQRLRDEFAQVVRPEHAALAVRLRELRPWAKAHLPTYEARRDYFAGLVRDELG